LRGQKTRITRHSIVHGSCFLLEVASVAFHPEMIVLFGSHARGDAGPGSDVDLLVVMPVNGSKRDLTIAMRKALAGIGLAKDVVVATPEELARYRDLVGTIIYPAIHEGKVLYERSA
jgi:uncharacterized protein